MLWNIMIAVWIGIIATTIIVMVAKAYWARRLGHICPVCKWCEGDRCYAGLGWEPLPAIRTCSRWNKEA